MDRISRKNVEGIFGVFVKALGGHIAATYNDVGGYRLDYISEYGGYNVEQISSDKGSVSQPFGAGRSSISEMFYMLHFAVRVIETLKEKAPI